MESMTGLQNAAPAKLCLKRGIVLKPLDWVACVRDMADIVTLLDAKFSETHDNILFILVLL